MTRQSKKQSKKNKKSQIIIAIFVFLFIIVSYSFEKAGIWDKIDDSIPADSHQSVSADGVCLTADFIDVGQGDCTLFVSDGKSMLIDSGELEYSDFVVKEMKELGVTELDYVVATHAHSDHIGATANIITAVPAENIILSEPSDKSSETDTYEKFMTAVETSGANVILAEPKYKFALGKAECEILAPFEVSQKEENNNSVVMTVTAGETTFLMTGDAEKSVENRIIKEYPNLCADILKAGHHGSNTSSSENFVNLISPETAIISVGEKNRYKHPSDEILQLYDSLNIKYYRTDVSGRITVTCTDNSYFVSTEK